MKGGLLQLISNEDNKLVHKNPHFSYFKHTYNRHTNFSIDNNIRHIGKFKFGNNIEYKFKKEGDLLGDIHLNIYLPKIINTITIIISYQ